MSCIECTRPIVVKSVSLCMPCYKRKWRRDTGRLTPRVTQTAEERRQKAVISSRRHYAATRPERVRRAATYREEKREELKAARQKPEHKEKLYERSLQKLYGIGSGDVEKMKADQQGLCPVCEEPLLPRGLAPLSAVVDHCHETGKVRGVLHRRCNSVLGLIGEDTAALRRAADYLEGHRFR